MNDWWFVIALLNVVAIGCAVGLSIMFRVRNAISVDPNKRERAVMRDVLSGRAYVLPPGTYYLTGEQDLLERVSTNEDPIDPPAERIRSADDIEMEIDYGYSMRIRREPNLQDPDDTSKSEEELLNKYVLQAVLRMDVFDDRKKRIQREVSSVMDRVFRELRADQLKLPAEQPTFLDMHGNILKSDPANPLQAPAGTARTVAGAEELYKELVGRCHRRVDEALGDVQTGIGMEILNFRVRDVRYRNSEVQKRAEKLHEAEKIRRAVDKILQQKKRKGEKITPREAMAIALGQDQSFSQVATEQIKAELTREWQKITRETAPAVLNQISDKVVNAILKKGPLVTP